MIGPAPTVIRSPLHEAHKARYLALAVGLGVLLGLVDWLTGPFLSLTVFYLFPVALAAWYAGRREAIAISLLCAVIWTAADLESFRTHLPLALDLWNAAVRLVFFFIVAYTLTAARGALDRENALARQIQQSLLPASLPRLDGIDVAALYRPATVLSGDFFDIQPTHDGGLAVSIADVAGKGPGPALLMASLQAAMRALVATDAGPAELCGELNAFVGDRDLASRFVTFFTCRIDASRMRLTYCNAGHNPPILLRHDGSWRRLGTTGIVLGIVMRARYEEVNITLASGDTLVLYTDGLTEATDRAGREFGEARMIGVVREHPGAAASELQERLIGEVERFSRGRFQDDVTVVVLRLATPADRLHDDPVLFSTSYAARDAR